MAQVETTWAGSKESGRFENSDGFYIENIDNVWKLGNTNLDEEDIDYKLSLADLFANPVLGIALLDPQTGKLFADILPNILVGNTIIVNTINEMLDLNSNQVQIGDICVVKEVQGGASFRLSANPISELSNWTELVSRFANWKDIQGKPKFLPPYTVGEIQTIPSSKHNHDDRYPVLDNQDKIPTDYIRALPTGNKFRVSTLPEMLSTSALKGDVCVVTSIKKRFQLFGLASNLIDWLELEDPTGLVASVNGQSGNVVLTAEDVEALGIDTTPADIGASDIEHEHNFIKTLQNSEISFHHDGINLYYTLNGGVPLPFA